jgi:L-threonylcarbamoyladenylate synthase
VENWAREAEVQTRILAHDAPGAMLEAAELIRKGELVAFPTETVYGLGANALCGQAVQKIFAAKGRPGDNPLIAHVCDIKGVEPLVARIPPLARRAMEAFWPGPLTIVFPKSGAVPDAVTAGLDTVAVRFPSHPVARALIERAACPIAAPSANRSGRPSPTNAQDVYADMQGRIPLILDGGACGVGVESTVLDVSDGPLILRPGGVTQGMLEQALGMPVRVHQAALKPLEGEARSPGMKYKHYAPKAQVVLVEGEPEAMAHRAAQLYDEALAKGRRPCILGTEELKDIYGERAFYPLGKRAQPESIAHNLFAALREMDRRGYDAVFCETVEAQGVGLAIMNRLVRAAGYKIVKG